MKLPPPPPPQLQKPRARVDARLKIKCLQLCARVSANSTSCDGSRKLGSASEPVSDSSSCQCPHSPRAPNRRTSLFPVRISSSSARGSKTFPDRMCAPTSAPFSTTHTLRSSPVSSASCFSRIAAASPAGPAPTVTTSYSITSARLVGGHIAQAPCGSRDAPSRLLGAPSHERANDLQRSMFSLKAKTRRSKNKACQGGGGGGGVGQPAKARSQPFRPPSTACRPPRARSRSRRPMPAGATIGDVVLGKGNDQPVCRVPRWRAQA